MATVNSSVVRRLLLCGLLLLVASCEALLPTSEYYALQSIFNSTGGDGWTWKLPFDRYGSPWVFQGPAVSNPCAEGWQGLNCTGNCIAGSCSISMISLGNYSLRNAFPSAFTSFPSLRALDLSQNTLTGSIPAEIALLTALEVMNVAGNRLNGTLPSALLTLPALRQLTLSSNRLTGTFPSTVHSPCPIASLDIGQNEELGGPFPSALATCTAMATLRISDCAFTGPLPRSISNWTHIVAFDGSNNSFSGAIPSTLAAWTTVASLNLNGNDLTGTIPSYLATMDTLTSLELGNNRLRGSLPTNWSPSARLEALSVASNQLTGTIPPQLWQLPRLTEIDFSHNHLVGSIPTVAIGSAQLVNVTLSDNALTGSVPSSLFAAPNVTYLDVSLNRLHGSLPDAIASPSALQCLFAHDNALTGALPASLQHAASLAAVDVSDNQLTGGVSDALVLATPGVRLFSIARNYLTGSLPASFSHWASLSILHAGSNHLAGSFPAGFLAAGSLLVLTLPMNHLSGPLAALTLTAVPQLQMLSLYDNVLTGTLPAAVGTLQRLTSLLVAENQLTGTLPASLVHLPKLRQCSLAQNGFHGNVTWWLSSPSLASLTQIDLSGNAFTGPIVLNTDPAELEWLSVLDLAKNAFTGTIPANINATSLRLLFLNGNQLQGTVPPSLATLTTLQYLNLSANHLEGSLGAFLNPNGPYGFLSFSENLFSGPIDEVFRRMQNLFIVTVHDNLLTGPVTNLVDPAYQRFLLKVDVSNNRLTGSLPSSLFQAPELQSFLGASNCFVGNLPTAVCTARNLTSLVLDGLHTSPGCNRKMLPWVDTAIYTLPRALRMDYIPVCLFALPKLQLLHLSGNAISGTFVGPVNTSRSLRDVDLSHNALSGTIPPAFFDQFFDSLDLSFNQFSGTIPDDVVTTTGAANASSRSYMALALHVNRLSGTIPASVSALPTVNVLEGNLFSCDNGDFATLPQHDPKFASYECGSDTTNHLIIAWWCLLVGCALCVVLFVRNATLISLRQGYHVVRETRRFTSSPLLRDILDGTAEAMAETERLSVHVSPFHERIQSVEVPTFDLAKGVARPTSAASAASSSAASSASSSASSSAQSLSAVSSVFALGALTRVHHHSTDELMPRGASSPYNSSRDPLAAVATTTTTTTAAAETNHMFLLLLENQFLRKFLLLICGYVVFVLVPVYAALTAAFGTYTYQYVWTVAFAFMKGSTPAAVLLVFFLVFVAAIHTLVYLHLVVKRESAYSITLVGQVLSARASESLQYWARLSVRVHRRHLLLAVLFVVNCAVVLAVNGGFVYAVSQSYDRDVMGVLSFLLGLFKLTWSSVVVLGWMERASRELLSPTRQSLFLVVLSIFNNIFAPYASEAFVSPSCFEYSIVPPAPDVSTLTTEACFLYSATPSVVGAQNASILCGHTVGQFATLISALANPVTTVSFTPPFIYSYQCSSSLVTVFASVFIIRYMLSGIVQPVLTLLMKIGQLYCLKRVGVGSRWFRFWTQRLPVLYRPISLAATVWLASEATLGTASPMALAVDTATEENAPAIDLTLFELTNDEILLSVKKPLTLRMIFAVRLISDMAVLLTFGVMFPPLALMVTFSMVSDMFQLEYGMGRVAQMAVLDPRPQAQVRKLLCWLNDSFEGFGDGIWQFFPVLSVFCSLLWSFSFFDLLSNDSGGVDAIWIIPFVVCFPLFIEILHVTADALYRKYRAQAAGGRATTAANAHVEETNDIELHAIGRSD